MWARIARFEGGDFEQMQQLSESRMQEGSVPAGMQGVLVLANAGRTERLFISFFESREAIEEAAAEFERMGDEIPEETRGRRISLEQYEVVFEQLPVTTSS